MADDPPLLDVITGADSFTSVIETVIVCESVFSPSDTCIITI